MEVGRDRGQRGRKHRAVHVLHEQGGRDDEGGQNGGTHSGLVGRSPCGAARGSRQAHDRSGRRDAAHKRVIGPRGATERSMPRPAVVAFQGFDAAARRRPTLTIRVASEWRNVGADFSSASSDFRALGAFFCPPVASATFSRLIGRSRARSARAHVPDLVGSRPPRPYHFRARIQSFQAVAAPFPGGSVLQSGRERWDRERARRAPRLSRRRSASLGPAERLGQNRDSFRVL